MYSPAALPSRLRAAPAKKRRLSTIAPISSSLTACSGLPALRASSSAISSPCSSSASASLSSASERSPGVVFAQPSKAFRAALTARSMSSAVESGACAKGFPSAGLSTSVVRPSTAGTDSPPMKLLKVPVSVAAICAPPQVSLSATLPPGSGRLQAEQLRRVVAQHGVRDGLGQLEPVELGEAGLGVEHRVVGAEQELPAQPARDLALDLVGEIAVLPAGDVEVDVGLVQRHRHGLQVPGPADVGEHDLQAGMPRGDPVEQDRAGEVDPQALPAGLARAQPTRPRVGEQRQAQLGRGVEERQE